MIYCIGEALIDMLPSGNEAFYRYAGGSIANVACCLALLGSKVSLISKVGDDADGRFLIDVINKYGVDTSKVFLTQDKKTGIVYFSKNQEEMEEVAAKRENSADRYLYGEQIKPKWFTKDDILHFSSVCLVDKPVKYAQKKAIEYMVKAGGRLSFDINYRPRLWKNKNDFLSQVWDTITHIDYLKLSEFDFMEIQNNNNYEIGIKDFFKQSKRLKIILLTKGDRGAQAFLRDSSKINIDAFKVKAIDTLGAGDCFMGCFLYLIENFKILPDKNQLKEVLNFCAAASALQIAKKGAINSLPCMAEIIEFLDTKGMDKPKILLTVK